MEHKIYLHKKDIIEHPTIEVTNPITSDNRTRDKNIFTIQTFFTTG